MILFVMLVSTRKPHFTFQSHRIFNSAEIFLVERQNDSIESNCACISIQSSVEIAWTANMWCCATINIDVNSLITSASVNRTINYRCSRAEIIVRTANFSLDGDECELRFVIRINCCQVKICRANSQWGAIPLSGFGGSWTTQRIIDGERWQIINNVLSRCKFEPFESNSIHNVDALTRCNKWNSRRFSTHCID